MDLNKTFVFACLGLWACGVATSVGAFTCTPDKTLQLRGVTARMENDLFAGTDRNYTNGVSFALISKDIPGQLEPSCLPQPMRLYGRLLNRIDAGFSSRASADNTSQNLVLRVGQNMYTPKDNQRHDLIEDDRPYAGLLYVGLAWNRRLPMPNRALEMLETRALTLGMIGPASMAKQTQDFVHGIRGLDKFNGWSHQLHNEPAFQVALERKYKRLEDNTFRPGLSHDFVSRWGIRLGNIQTSINAGLEWRAGWNISNDFGSYPISAGDENRPPLPPSARHSEDLGAGALAHKGAHVFANIGVRTVAWDFSLDGNLFRKSHHVTRRPLVAQGALGISSQWALWHHDVRLALMRVWRSREFRHQHTGHTFDSITLSMDF